MTQDRLIAVDVLAVMHQPAAGAHAPERRRADLQPGSLSAVLDDAIAGTDVMQREIAERVDALVAERRRNGERPAVDHRAWRDGVDLGDVADGATNSVEEVAAGDGVRCGSQSGVTRRSL